MCSAHKRDPLNEKRPGTEEGKQHVPLSITSYQERVATKRKTVSSLIGMFELLFC